GSTKHRSSSFLACACPYRRTGAILFPGAKTPYSPDAADGIPAAPGATWFRSRRRDRNHEFLRQEIRNRAEVGEKDIQIIAIRSGSTKHRSSSFLACACPYRRTGAILFPGAKTPYSPDAADGIPAAPGATWFRSRRRDRNHEFLRQEIRNRAEVGEKDIQIIAI